MRIKRENRQIIDTEEIENGERIKRVRIKKENREREREQERLNSVREG